MTSSDTSGGSTTMLTVVPMTCSTQRSPPTTATLIRDRPGRAPPGATARRRRSCTSRPRRCRSLALFAWSASWRRIGADSGRDLAGAATGRELERDDVRATCHRRRRSRPGPRRSACRRRGRRRCRRRPMLVPLPVDCRRGRGRAGACAARSRTAVAPRSVPDPCPARRSRRHRRVPEPRPAS